MIKQPKLLLLASLIGLFLILGLWLTLNTEKPRAATAKTSNWDIEAGDTNNELLRTVVANQEKLKTDNAKLEKANARLERQLSRKNSADVQQTKQQLQAEISATQQSLNRALLAANTAKQNQNSGSDAYDITTKTKISTSSPTAPIGNIADISNVQATPTAPAPMPTPPRHGLVLQHSATQNISSKKSVVPVYTVPSGSTMAHVSLMTALIGEVPVSGRLVEPAFPFKAIVGRRELLAANGLHLPPELSGMILQGYSVGNMTMSCTRAYVTQVLFVFQDGHFVVWPKKETSSATNLYPQNSLGFLSTQYGNPCLPGRYITDAPKVIANLAALGGIANMGNMIAQQQMTTVSTGFQTSQNLTGSMGKFAAGSFAGGASNAALAWYTDRVSDIFDAVYIPAAFYNSVTHRPSPTSVTFNVTSTIPIDFDKKGRMLRENQHKNRYRRTRLD